MLVNTLAPDLSSLAANAAVELDLVIQGEQSDLGAVKELADRLAETLVGDGNGQAARRLHVDTATETVLGKAFAQAGEDPTTILSDLFRRTEEVAKELSSTQPSSNRTSLEWQRAFCLSLSQAASAYRQLMFNARPPHPYRR